MALVGHEFSGTKRFISSFSTSDKKHQRPTSAMKSKRDVLKKAVEMLKEESQNESKKEGEKRTGGRDNERKRKGEKEKSGREREEESEKCKERIAGGSESSKNEGNETIPRSNSFSFVTSVDSNVVKIDNEKNVKMQNKRELAEGRRLCDTMKKDTQGSRYLRKYSGGLEEFLPSFKFDSTSPVQHHVFIFICIIFLYLYHFQLWYIIRKMISKESEFTQK